MWRGALAAALALAAPAPVNPPEPEARTATPATGLEARRLSGTLDAVDLAGGQLSIALEHEVQPLSLSDDPTIFVDGRLSTVKALQKGQKVRAAFNEEDGVRTLRWLEVLPDEPPKAPGKAR